MVLDNVIHDFQDFPQTKVQKSLLLGGPPSFAGIVGLILSKIYTWLPPPLVYAYACPKAITLIKNIPDYSLILTNIKLHSNCPHFQLEYSNEKQGRTLFLENSPIQFNPYNFNWKFGESLPTTIIGSVYHEFTNPEIFTFLRDKCSYIAFDAQGCFRQRTQEGKIVFRDWWDLRIIENIDCLKISETEAKFMNLGAHPYEIISKVLETNVSSVLFTRGKHGSILGTKNRNRGEIQLYEVPTFTEGTIVDETGAGDVFLYSYVIHFQSFNDELNAVAFATSVTSLFIEQNRFQAEFSEKKIQFRQRKIKANITEFLRL